MYKHILIASDGSDLSGKAVDAGIQLAAQLQARATVVTVTPPFQMFSLNPDQIEYSRAEYRQHVEQEARRILDEARQKAEAVGLPCDTVHAVHEHPWQAIIETADARGCDLITMSSHGRSGFTAIVMGSETQRVLTHSALPVLVHR